jgi:heat shock protein HslJ
MRRTMPRLVILATLIFSLAACQANSPDNSAGPAGAVTGSVTYAARIALPADAVVKVAVVDVTGGANTVLGSQAISTDGNQAPIPFEVGYTTAAINQTHDYAVGATIEDGAGTVLFETATTIPVITQGNPSQDVVVTVVAASGDPAAVADTASGLPGTLWGLVSLGGNPPVEGTTVTAQFAADGSLSGSDGCNRYSASYTVEGSTLTVTPGMSTMMACAEPIMAQATAFSKALASAASYTIDGEMLNLVDASGATVLTFQANAQQLAETTWHAILYNNGKNAVTSVTLPTIAVTFDADGTISGFGGCNNFNGTYTVSGNTIQIGALATTPKACSEPAGIMDEESQFLAALQSATIFQIEGQVLQMQSKDGELAVQLERTE